MNSYGEALKSIAQYCTTNEAKTHYNVKDDIVIELLLQGGPWQITKITHIDSVVALKSMAGLLHTAPDYHEFQYCLKVYSKQPIYSYGCEDDRIKQ